MPVRPHLAAALVAGLLACGGGDGPGPGDGGPTSDGSPPIDARPPLDAAPEFDAGPPGSTCLDPLPITLGVDVVGDTTGYPTALDSICSPLTAGAPQIIHQVEVGDVEVDLLVEVAVDEGAEPPYDAVVYVRPACALGGPCADRGYSERLEALAVSGAPLVIVDGTVQHGGAANGPFTLSTAARPIRGQDASCDPAGLASRCAEGLRCVAGACALDSPELACAQARDLTAELADGATSRTAALAVFEPDLTQLGCAFDPESDAGEVRFRFALDAPADLIATTDFGATDFDTAIALRSGDCHGDAAVELACADDVDAAGGNFASRLEVDDLPAGVYYLIVDGSSAVPSVGTFRLDVTLSSP